MPARPAVSIDFGRSFSLPVGVPPDLPTPALTAYLGGLATDATFLYLDRPERQTLDPAFVATGANLRVRSLTLGADQLLVPRSSGLVPGLPAADLTLPRARVADSGGAWTPAAETPGRSMAQVAASRFRWDDDARKAAPLPQPLLTDESLVLYWPDVAPQAPLLTTALPGILENDAATHLLASSTTARDGELDRTLLRSPALGLVRFERYRHLVLRSGRLEVAQPSATGAWVLSLVPGGIVVPSVISPLEDPRTLVIEHVALQHAIACTARIVALHVIQLPVVLDAAKFRAAVLAQMSWLFRSWLAWLRIVAPVHRPGAPDPSPGIPAAVKAPFEGATAANRTRVEAMRNHVMGDATARASLLDFITAFYAPLLCGRSWLELGVDLPSVPSTRPVALRPAHRTLEHLTRSSETWLLAYAGCPLGRPGRLYEPLTPAGPVAPRPLGRLTTFDLEAAAIARLTAAQYPAVAAPDVSDPLKQVDLTGFAVHSPGALSVLRAVDANPPRQEFTTFEWLSEIVKGANRAVRQEAALAFDDYAAAGHPLAGALRWPLWREAVELHERMKRLQGTTFGPVHLGQRSIDWWSAATGLLDSAGKWPAVTPAGGDTREPPTPSEPFRSSTTQYVESPIPWSDHDGVYTGIPTHPPRITGFDEFDLESALRASRVVRNGKSMATDLDPALFLALLEREGFRSSASGERRATLRSIPGAFPAAVRADVLNADHIGMMAWLIFPFGLDMVVRNKPLQNLSFTDPALVTKTRNNFSDHFSLRIDAQGLLDPTIDPLIDWGFALRYLTRRRAGSWPPVGLYHQTASRTAHWLAFAIHQATFQWVHRLLHQATTPRKSTPAAGGNPYVQVPEFVAGTVPALGADATTEERRRYLAYWALVYLAFNVREDTWNEWVNAVPDPVLAGGTSIGEYLLYHHNTVPTALEPPGGVNRVLGQRGNMLRFAVSLDAYLRLAHGAPAEDASDPMTRTWPVVP